jgi:hypothetical protein
MNAFALLDALTTPVWIILPDSGELLFANRQASQLSGKPWPACAAATCRPAPWNS